MEEKFENLGTLIDELDSLAHGLKLNMPNELHVESMRQSLPEKVKRLKESFVEITGENPWDLKHQPQKRDENYLLTAFKNYFNSKYPCDTEERDGSLMPEPDRELFATYNMLLFYQTYKKKNDGK